LWWLESGDECYGGRGAREYPHGPGSLYSDIEVDEDDVKRAAVDMNKAMLAGQSKIMKGELKSWL